LLCAERGASFASVSVCPLTAQVITLRPLFLFVSQAPWVLERFVSSVVQ
jgi:hypothetical protein